MNHIYRLVWSTRLGKFIVTHEKARSHGRASSGARIPLASGLLGVLISALSTGVAWATPPAANTLPTGYTVSAGAANVSSQGNTLTVQQSTPRTAIDWQTFSIGSNAQVNFVQPSASAVVLNRVVGNESTVIDGALQANGQVFVLNSNGVLIGQGARIDAQGFLASTLGLSNEDFIANKRSFSGTSNAGLMNLGTIKAKDGGYVALLGAQVSNQGLISAQLGTVALAAGQRVRLNFNGDSLMGVTIEQGALNALVENKQAIYADGGQVILTAQGLDAVLSASVNNTGLIQAQTIGQSEGHIYLLGDKDTTSSIVAGTLDASAPLGGKGGNIAVTGYQVEVHAGALLDASGAQGGGTIEVGGGLYGADPNLAQATSTTVQSGATLDASATAQGKGGTIAVWSDVSNPASQTRAYGTLLARGGAMGGDGGTIETSGHWLDVKGIQTDASAANGQAGLWLLDPYNVTIGSSTSGDSYTGPNYSPNAQDSTILASDISSALSNNNVTITTKASAGTSVGDITVASAITKSSGSATTLTLAADRNIYVNQNISGSSGHPLNVVLAARYEGGNTGGVGLTASILSYGGDITIGGGDINASGYAIANSDVQKYIYDSGPSAAVNSGSALLKQSGIAMRGTSNFNTVVFVDASTGASSQNLTGSSPSTNTDIANFVHTLANATGGGNVVLRGQGNPVNTYPGSQGLWISPGGVLTSGSGTISLIGYGGLYSSDFWGVGGAGIVIEGSQTNASYVMSGNGYISVNGTGNPSSYNDHGYVSTGTVYFATKGAFGLSGTDLMIRNGQFYVYSELASDFFAPVVGTTNAGGAGQPTLYIASPSTSSTTFHGDATSTTANNTGRTDGILTVPSGDPILQSAGITPAQALHTFGVTSTTASVSGSTSGTITVAQVSLTGLTIAVNATENYGGAVTYTYTNSGGALANGDTLSSVLTGLPICASTCINASLTPYTLNVGSLGIAPGYGSKYSMSWANGALTINPATLTYIANAASMSYGSSVPSLSGSVTGLVNGDSLSGATTGSATYSSTASATSNVGSYAINGSGLSASNYNFVQAVSNATALAISRAPLTITASNATKTYGQTAALTAFTSSGLQNSETIGSVTETSSGSAATAGVGSSPYTIVPSAATGGTFNAANYSITYANGALAVSQAPLTYVANTASVGYGSSSPSLSGFVTGFLNSDTVANATTGTLAFSSTVTTNSNVGSYAITGSGLSASNYSFVQAAGNTTALTLVPATLTYLANAVSLPAGSNPPAFNGVVTGFVNNDTLTSATTGTAVWSSTATASSAPGQYAINGSGLTANHGNYVFVQSGNNTSAFDISLPTGINLTVANSLKPPATPGSTDIAFGAAPVLVSAMGSVPSTSGPETSVHSATVADSPTQLLGLSQAIALLQTSHASSKPTTDNTKTPLPQDMRIPIQRESQLSIVNGGLQLPAGVEQLVFVEAPVAAN